MNTSINNQNLFDSKASDLQSANFEFENSGIKTIPGDCANSGIVKLKLDEDYTNVTPVNSVGMASVGYQSYEAPIELSLALKQGTIFKCLNKPFLGTGGKLL